MKKLVFVCLAQLLIMCSTNHFQVRDDFEIVSQKEKTAFLKTKNAVSNNKSVIILTQGFKGEKIIAKQNDKTIYSAYPITNLKAKYADSFSFENTENVLIKDNFSAKEINLNAKKIKKYKFIYIMKYKTDKKVHFKITLSNSLRPTS